MKMANFNRVIGITTVAAVLSSCGGGDIGSETMYPFVTPALNSQATYSAVFEDSSNTTVNETMTLQITSVSSSGAFTQTTSAAGGTNTVNGITYGTPEDGSFDNTGHELGFTYPLSNGQTGSCTNNPDGIGPPVPLTVGETWTLQFTQTCNGGAGTAFTQTGTVLDVESVTVPAGTYQALRVQSTLTWTNSQGTTRQESITNWRDVDGLGVVKESITYTLTGTAPSGDYIVSEVRELLSKS